MADVKEWISVNDRLPGEGGSVEGLYSDGTTEEVRWQEQRYCMLGAPMGSRGPGFTSEASGWLPVDDITHWREL